VTVVSLARMLATGGERVIVIDCDLRRPRVHKIFGVQAGPGIMELLQGSATLEDVTQRDSSSQADLIPAGQPMGNPTGLLASNRRRGLPQTRTRRCDWVIMDSAPVLALSDSRSLARQVHRVPSLMRWART